MTPRDICFALYVQVPRLTWYKNSISVAPISTLVIQLFNRLYFSKLLTVKSALLEMSCQETLVLSRQKETSNVKSPAQLIPQTLQSQQIMKGNLRYHKFRWLLFT